MGTRFVAPELSQSYSCPHCNALAHQTWFNTYILETARNEPPLQVVKDDFATEIRRHAGWDADQQKNMLEEFTHIHNKIIFAKGRSLQDCVRLVNINFALCYSCKKFTVWTSGKVIYPDFQNAVLPNDDLPDDIKKDFHEAVEILRDSPRGSAALLRLCVQKLCKFLGEKGRNINEDIGSLVAKGLDPKIQKALDVVRVIGNDAVHPGQIDLSDNAEIAQKLFQLVNLIADAMISQPKAVDELYRALPATKLMEIARRDSNGSSEA